MTLRTTLGLAALTLVLSGPTVRADEVRKQTVSFGALEPVTAEAARGLAQNWLKAAGKTDMATQEKFDAIWKQEERPVLDRLADTFVLGDATAAMLMSQARNPLVPAPTKVPEAFKDQKNTMFYRANLALAFARALSNRHVYDEALQSLVLFRPEQVVDPSVYLFHRAVCEHALLQKTEAGRTITRLLEDAQGSPERYRTVSALMLLDMQTWKDKDLGAVARKMKVVEDRLDLARGGPETQKKQKEIIARLDELIKELENKQKGSSDANGGQCPNGGQQPGGNQPGNQGGPPNQPMQDSQIAGQSGQGTVDQVKMRKTIEGWGRMAPREQARALQELTRGLSPRHREAIENYFRNLAQSQRR